MKVEWTKEMETAFNTIRELVANQCSLTIPLPEDCMSIHLGVGLAVFYR